MRGKPFAAGQTYFRSVERAGGIPLMMPPIISLIDDIPSLLRRVDAVVFHGGGDVDPRRYGQRANEESLYGIVEEHDAVELAMMAAAIESDVPVFAICRGLQVLNVVRGGTLVQDIGTDITGSSSRRPSSTPARVAKAMVPTYPSDATACITKPSIASVMYQRRRAADGLIHAVEIDPARWVVRLSAPGLRRPGPSTTGPFRRGRPPNLLTPPPHRHAGYAVFDWRPPAGRESSNAVGVSG